MCLEVLEEILAHKNDTLVGKNASDAGFSSDLKAGKGKGKMELQKRLWIILRRSAEEQENAITDLNDIMNQLSIELEKNSESSLDIAHKTQETVHRMIETKDKMEFLEFSISEIEATYISVGIIANMVRNNAQDIQKAVEGLEQISSVVKQNVTILQGSEQTAQKLAVESEQLLGLIE